MDEKEIIITLAKVEEREKSNSHRITALENDKAILHELKTLMSVSISTQKDISEQLKQTNERQSKFDDRLDSYDKTIGNVNLNLTHLNSNQESMKNEIIGIKEDISSTKDHVKAVEKKASANDERGKFDLLDFLTKNALPFILIAILGAFLALIGLK